MRPKERLTAFYSELEFVHKQFFQDLRFGQFIHVFFTWITNNYLIDTFYVEEDEMLEYLRKFARISNNYNGEYDFIN